MLTDVILNVIFSYIIQQFFYVKVGVRLKIREGVLTWRQTGLNRIIERACEEEKVSEGLEGKKVMQLWTIEGEMDSWSDGGGVERWREEK